MVEAREQPQERAAKSRTGLERVDFVFFPARVRGISTAAGWSPWLRLKAFIELVWGHNTLDLCQHAFIIRSLAASELCSSLQPSVPRQFFNSGLSVTLQTTYTALCVLALYPATLVPTNTEGEHCFPLLNRLD